METMASFCAHVYRRMRIFQEITHYQLLTKSDRGEYFKDINK